MDAGIGVPDFVAVAAAASLSGATEDASVLAEAIGSPSALAGLSLAESALAPTEADVTVARLLGLPAEPGIPAVAWRTDAERGTALVLFTQDAAVRAATGLIEADPGGAGLGAPLPEEVSLRLGAAAKRPGLAGHFRRSAVDALARHALEMAASLPGATRLPGGIVAWAGSFGRGEASEALAWLWQPGPGRYAAALLVLVPGGTP